MAVKGLAYAFRKCVLGRLCLAASCILLSICTSVHLQAQVSGKNAATPGSIVSLAKPVDFNFFTARMFEDDPHQITFHLVTSWIPGEGHKGMLRYQSSAMLAEAQPLDANSQELLMKRVARCLITLNLLDDGGFVLRKHFISLLSG